MVISNSYVSLPEGTFYALWAFFLSLSDLPPCSRKALESQLTLLVNLQQAGVGLDHRELWMTSTSLAGIDVYWCALREMERRTKWWGILDPGLMARVPQNRLVSLALPSICVQSLGEFNHSALRLQGRRPKTKGLRSNFSMACGCHRSFRFRFRETLVLLKPLVLIVATGGLQVSMLDFSSFVLAGGQLVFWQMRPFAANFSKFDS